MYIFAYGSLINLKSTSKALGHSINKENVLKVNLVGYTRTWDLVETIYSNALKKDVSAVFLNLTKQDGMFVNGILISISSEELSNIASREKNYNMIDVSSNILLSRYMSKKNILLDKVYTAIAKQECTINSINRLYFLTEYEKLVMNGVVKLGNNFLQEYKSTTETSTLKKLRGEYKFVDPLQNSLA